MNEPYRILHIADLHHALDPASEPEAGNREAWLNRIRTVAAAYEAFDLVVCTGDVGHKGKEVALKEGYPLESLVQRVKELQGQTVYRVTDLDREQSFLICLDDVVSLETVRPLLDRDTLFVCRDVALNDDTTANLALQCRLKTI